MGNRFKELSDELIQFITGQKLFFVGTATADSRINISPKGMDSLRVVDRRRVVWLNVTGSGNETSGHVQVDPRMTLMFCALEGLPRIVRLYGSARVIHKNDPYWAELLRLFPPLPGARQIFDLSIDLVQSSCGMAVPHFKYLDQRELLNGWAEKKGEERIKEYWRENNELTIDGIPTHITEKNG